MSYLPKRPSRLRESESDMNEEAIEYKENGGEEKRAAALHAYKVQFRADGQIFSALSRIPNLQPDEAVMIKTDHGFEPAVVRHRSPMPPEAGEPRADLWISRRANREEREKYDRLPEREKQAFSICQELIAKHGLAMKLVRVERFFNGSKIIFYFTAENRVDFRALVKDLVQEFRTRVEIRQIGVRHETKMIGGLGPCGRELCCSSFISEFAPVSIKMAKTQNLPLNPSKISGLCNRLLCCLTYEFETYRELRRGMPKVGKSIMLDGVRYKVVQANILAGTVSVMEPGVPDSHRVLGPEDWKRAEPPPPPQRAQGKKQKKKKRTDS